MAWLCRGVRPLHCAGTMDWPPLMDGETGGASDASMPMPAAGDVEPAAASATAQRQMICRAVVHVVVPDIESAQRARLSPSPGFADSSATRNCVVGWT